MSKEVGNTRAADKFASWQSGAGAPTNQTISFSFLSTPRCMGDSSFLWLDCQEAKLVGRTSRSSGGSSN